MRKEKEKQNKTKTKLSPEHTTLVQGVHGDVFLVAAVEREAARGRPVPTREEALPAWKRPMSVKNIVRGEIQFSK